MRQIKGGAADVSIDLYIIDSTDGTPELGVTWDESGIDLKYRRESSTVVPITEATLAALTTPHADGGFLEIGNGVYRLDLPDLAVAAGAKNVVVFGTVTGMIVIPVEIQIVAYDPDNTTNLGLLALPAAQADTAGGLPISDAGNLDLDTKLANTNEITAARMGALTDWIDAGRLDVILDAVKTVTDNIPNAGAMTTLITHLTDIKGTSFAKDTHSLTDILTDVTGLNGDAMVGTNGANTVVPDAAGVAPTAIENRQEMDSNSVELGKIDGIVTVTDGIQTDLDNATDGLGALKTLVDAIQTDLDNGTDGLGALKTVVDGLQTDLDNGTDGLGALKTLIDAVQTVADGVQTDLSNGTDGLGALKTLIDNQLTTVLTEAYAADGSTASVAQLLYMIWSVMNSLNFVSTTGTARKLDGATTAMEFTLDDADDPTDINRTL